MKVEVSANGKENETNKTLSRVRRIMGGRLETIDQFPYLVYMTVEYSDGLLMRCGGTILSNEWIVTAAHCLRNYETTRCRDIIRIRAGSHFMIPGQSNHSYTEHTATRIRLHESFNSIDLKNDIALVKVSPPFVWDLEHQPIRIIEDDREIKLGDIAITAGYGLSGANPNHLQNDFMLRSTELPIVDSEKCRREFNIFLSTYVGPNIICAGYTGTEIHKSTCKGDSGGPLVLNGRLVGVLSYGESCSKPFRRPAAFTKVAAYREWIDASMSLSDIYKQWIPSQCRIS